MAGGFFIYFGMFDGLIAGNLARAICESVDVERLTELRLRAGACAVALTTSLDRRVTLELGGKPYIVCKEDIDGIVARATNLSPYSVSDEIKRGYIPYGSMRIGVGGEGVSEGGRLLSVKNLSYMVIRVPHQIKSAADFILPKVERAGEVRSALIISPPGGGKTTVLRELARILSARHSVVLIDERYELAAVVNGVAALDVGEAEVISGVPKAVAYENCVRAMDPEVMITDEVFRPAEIESICDIVRCGVKVIASVHANGVEALRRDAAYAPLLAAFELAAVFRPVGQLVETVEL